MHVTQISATAAAAREAARGPGGKFGEQSHPENDVELATSPTLLSDALDRDGGDLAVLDEFDGTDIGRVHVEPGDDGGFRFVAGPEIELEELAPDDVDDSASWAEEHGGHFEDFMRSRYSLEIEGDEGRSLFGDWVVRAEGGLPADAKVEDVRAAVYEQNHMFGYLARQREEGSFRATFHRFLDEQTGPLDDVVDGDEPLDIRQDEHGDLWLGDVSIHREEDGSFVATAHPAIDLAALAPSELSDEDADQWADEHVDKFDDFMWRRYGFSNHTGVEYGYEQLEHTATARLGSGATTDKVTQALRDQNFGLAKRQRDLEEGTFRQAWGEHLANPTGEPFRCRGCGRPEEDCSADPCGDVVDDRG